MSSIADNPLSKYCVALFIIIAVELIFITAQFNIFAVESHLYCCFKLIKKFAAKFNIIAAEVIIIVALKKWEICCQIQYFCY